MNSSSNQRKRTAGTNDVYRIPFKTRKALIFSAVMLAGSFLFLSNIPENHIKVVTENEFVKNLISKFKTFQDKTPEDRVYLQTDKPMYKPGETIWFSTYVREAKTMYPSLQSDIVHAELISPKGTVMKKLNIITKNGQAAGDFELGTEVPGGMYKIKAYTQWQKNEGEKHLFEREFQVQKAVMPNLKMKLDFKRKAYGPGDKVEADLTLNTNANEPLKNHVITFAASLKGNVFTQQQATTNELGKHIIAFDLPADLNTSDGLLNVMISFEGKSESISRSIPISLNNISLSFFPEGGDLVSNLESNVAFRALNEFGKPADIEGEVRNSNGSKVASFKSFHNGMGAFEFQPKSGEKYTAHITKPEGIRKVYEMPEVLPKGFVLNASQNNRNEVELIVRSTEDEQISVVGQIRGKIYYSNAAKLEKGTNHLTLSTLNFPAGVMQFTLFDSKNIERAERLIFVNKDRQLNISLITNKEKYLPREKVRMTVRVTDDRGMPMPANLSVSVVNDQLLSFADDKSGNLLSTMLLSYDIKEKIEEPAFYFDRKEEKADQALDYLMMTAGWRRYTWEMVQNERFPTQKYVGERTEIAGKILDATTRKPIEGAYAQLSSLGNLKMYADQDGLYRFNGIEVQPGTIVSIQAPGYSAQSRNVYSYGSQNNFLLKPVRNKQVIYTALTAGNNIVYASPSATGASFTLQADQVLCAPSRTEHLNVAVFNEENIRPVSRPKSKKSSKSRSRAIAIPKAPAAEPARDFKFDASKKAENKNVIKQEVRNQREANEQIRNDIAVEELKEVAENKNKEIHFKKAQEKVVLDGLFDDIDKDVAFEEDEMELANGERRAAGGMRVPPHNQSSVQYYRAKQFPVTVPPKLTPETKRTDFRSTIYWNGNVEVGRNGYSVLEFYTSDEITSFKATMEGIGADGLLGRTEKKFYTQLPFTLAAKTPVQVATQDKVSIPVTLKNNTNRTLTGLLRVIAPFAFKQIGTFAKEHVLQPGESKTVNIDYEVMDQVGTGVFEASFIAGGLSDAFSQEIETVAKGFPATLSFSGDELKSDYEVDLHEVVDGSIRAEVTIFPSVVSDLISGVEGMLREPGGCFEQTSMSSYPNIMAVDYMNTMRINNEKVMASAEGMIDRGYKRLLTFETKTKGYEWFGQSPAHEGLTAYGLMQFNDMKSVYGKVDHQMVDRTAKWLLGRRDGKGKFLRNTDRQLHNFGRISEDIMNSYITYALIDAGYKGLDKELNYSYNKALETNDPYQMAMMANAAYQYGSVKKGDAMLSKLINIQEKDGAISGTTHSITYSTGKSLKIETTALAILAALEAPTTDRAFLNKAVKFLVNSRNGYGSFGNTQGTILALKALTAYAKVSKAPAENGIVEFYVDGKKVAERKYNSGGTDPIKMDDLGQYITPGKHKLRVKFTGVKKARPHAVAVSYSTTLPKSNPECKVQLNNSISSTDVKVGETVRLKTTIKNVTNKGIPSTIAIIGIPAGLSAQPWQLKELQEKKVFAYYEVRGNNIVAYYRGLAASETKEINLDLKAEVPGEFDAPASSAYLYYTNEFKSWNAIDRVKVTE